MYTCPYCYAQSALSSPHGEGVPCPSRLELHEAELDEKRAQAALLTAQRNLTEKARPR